MSSLPHVVALRPTTNTSTLHIHVHLVLSAICTHWRCVALGTPQLWRTLYLAPHNALKQLDLWTQRSASATTPSMRGVLDLRVPDLPPAECMSVMIQWGKSPRFHPSITPQAPLTLTFDTFSRHVYLLMKCDVYPRGLQSFTFASSDSSDDDLLPPCTSLFSSLPLPSTSFPSSSTSPSRDLPHDTSKTTIDKNHTLYYQLHHLALHIRTSLVPYTPPLPALRSLILPKFNAKHAQDLANFLSGCEELRELELGFVEGFHCTERTGYRTLPRLQRLKLYISGNETRSFSPHRRGTGNGRGSGEEGVDAQATWMNLLDRIDTPALTHLDLSPGSSSGATSASTEEICTLLSRAWARLVDVPPIVELRLRMRMRRSSTRCYEEGEAGTSSAGAGDGEALRDLVVQLSQLEVLEVTDCEDDLDPLLLALTSIGQEEADSTSGSSAFPCPHLKSLDISGCTRISSGAIPRLEASRSDLRVTRRCFCHIRGVC